MNIPLKVKSGALQLVVFVAVILFLLLSSFILLSYFNKLNKIDFLGYKELQVKNIEACKNTPLNILTKDFSFLGKEGVIDRELLNYGCFKVLKSTASLSKNKISNYAFVGGIPTKEAVVLENHQFGLSISGKTRLEGNLKLPKEGLKAGFVNGQYYYGSVLNYFGNISLSKEEIKEPQNIEILHSFLSRVGQINNENYIRELSPQKTEHHSFSLPTKIYRSYQTIHLKYLKLSGNLIIKSSAEIHVYKTSILKDVILIAPKIVIHSKVNGAFQSIATNEILVEKKVNLKYPSALILEEGRSNGVIKILEKAKISGILMYFKKRDKDFRTINVEIKDNVSVLGDVFCQGGLSVANSSIEGNVMTKYFIYNTLGSTYINMLLNVKISSIRKYKEYSGLSWSDEFRVMKWLY